MHFVEKIKSKQNLNKILIRTLYFCIFLCLYLVDRKNIFVLISLLIFDFLKFTNHNCKL
jgi:hypothetical protein